MLTVYCLRRPIARRPLARESELLELLAALVEQFEAAHYALPTAELQPRHVENS